MTRAEVVLGAMNYGTTVDERRAVELLDTFVERGGTWIDTADCYSFWNDPSGVGGASEHVLGGWLAARPGAPVKISTKVRHQPLVPHRWPGSAEGLSGIADLRRFTELLRSENGADDRVAFLHRRRDELRDRLRQTQAALDVLDDKIAYYSRD